MIPRLMDASSDPNLLGSALKVYVALVFDLSPAEFRSVKRLAFTRRLGIGERTFDRALADLIRWGYIEAGKRTPGSPQTYRLIWSQQREGAA